MEVKVPVRFEIKFRSNNLKRFTLRKNAVHTDMFFRTQSSRSHSVEQVDFDYVLQKKETIEKLSDLILFGFIRLLTLE